MFSAGELFRCAGEAPGLWQQLCTLQHGLSEVERTLSEAWHSLA